MATVRLMTRDELMARREMPASVPCGKCTACCKQDRIALGPKDDISRFQWHIEDGVPTLDRKPNGECIYLTASGCGKHDELPDICRRFDCRVLFLITPREKRRMRIEQNPSMKQVYEAGKKRLASLTTEDPSNAVGAVTHGTPNDDRAGPRSRVE